MKKKLLFLLLIVSGLQPAFAQEKRILVISGGGARGAWGAGLITAIVKKDHPDYRAIFSTSTGSLMAPLIANNDFEKLKLAYTNVQQKDVFNKNPFKDDGRIRMFPTIVKILFGKKNLGETQNLKKRITSFFSSEDYARLRRSGRSVNVSVVSLTKSRLSFKSSDSCNYEDMVDWVWASANQPIFMTTLDKDGEQWVDGGVKENVPVRGAVLYAKSHGIKTIDVIVNNINSDNANPVLWPKDGEKGNIISKLLRTIDIFSDEVRTSDILSGALTAEIDNVVINVYYMNESDFKRCPQSLLFKADVLHTLWASGENFFSHPEALLMPQTIKKGNVTINTFQSPPQEL